LPAIRIAGREFGIEDGVLYMARERVSTQKLLEEVGLTRLSFWKEWERDENPDDLVQKKKLTVYREMMRRDEMVKLGTRLVALAVVAPEWRVESAQAGDPLHDEIAAFVEWNLRGLPGTFKDTQLGILSGRAYGYSPTEINWGVIERGPWKGKFGLCSLKTKPPFLYGFRRDDFGNLEALVMESKYGEHKDLDPQKWIIYSHDSGSVFGDPHGQSVLRVAYRWYKARQLLLPLRGVFVEKTASGVPHVKYPRGISPQERAKYVNAGKKLQTAASFSSPDDVILEFVGLKTASWQEFQRFDDACARAILDGLLVPSHLGFGPKSSTGSHAESKVHQNIFEWIKGDLSTDLARSCLTEQLIYRLVDMNWDVDEYPSFKYEDRSWEEVVETVTTFTEASATGAVGPLTLADVNLTRQMLGYPELSEKEWEERQQDGPPSLDKEIEKPTPADALDDGDDVDSGDNPDVSNDGKRGIPQKVDRVPAVQTARREFPPISEAQVAVGVHTNAKYLRELNAQERAVGFKPDQIRKKLDKIEAGAQRQMVQAMGRIREKLIPKLDRSGLLDGTANEADLYVFGGLDAAGKRQFRDALHGLMLTGHLTGAVDAKEGLERGLGKKLDMAQSAPAFTMDYMSVEGDFLFPKEAAEYFKGLIPMNPAAAEAIKQRAFWVTGQYLNDNGMLLNKIKSAIQAGFWSGDWSSVEGRIDGMFDEWIGSGTIQTETVGGYRLYSPYHTETIVRTNNARAYNAGRMMMYMGVRDSWEVFQWSSIIDAVTTDFCDLMDGQPFRLGQVEAPPAHYDCRSTFFALLRGMAHEPVDDDRLARIAIQRSPAFKAMSESGLLAIV